MDYYYYNFFLNKGLDGTITRPTILLMYLCILLFLLILKYTAHFTKSMYAFGIDRVCVIVYTRVRAETLS